MPSSTRLIVVSNRLPVVLKQEDEKWTIKPGAGGLVSAMAPVLRDRGGVWVGWTGVTDPAGDKDTRELITRFSTEAGYELQPVPLTRDDVQGFYYGFANEIVWPLFHDFQSRCNFKPEYWRTYLEVNQKFAEQVAKVSTEDDYIWVHDYHLMHVAWMLRQMGVRRKVGFFLHIPFPSVDIFLKLPWRGKVIRALLEYDLLGFHTYRDRRNFNHCASIFNPDIKRQGKGGVITVSMPQRSLRVGAFPISIDFESFAAEAKRPEVKAHAEQFKKALQNRTIILGVDRLDYTKGVPQRLEAMAVALEKYPAMRGAVSLVQVLVPSRQEVPEYQALKEEIERMVGEINGRFTRPGYIPIHYQYRSLAREELVGYYRAADIALITPLRDGMNLVAKEYCACNLSNQGVLFLSEFAGAAAQLQNGAVLVNPYDVEGVADALHDALKMDSWERRLRMRRMRESIRRNDIFWWVDSFLSAAFSRHLGDFPAHPGEYPGQSTDVDYHQEGRDAHTDAGAE